MGTKISWCDETWNPVTGCTKIAQGCVNCYAERMSKRLKAMGQHKYRNEFKVTCHEGSLGEPLRWKKAKRIFVCSMSDLFHEDVCRQYIELVFSTMEQADHHTFLVLTKRIQRAAELLTYYDRIGRFRGSWPLPNVHLGTSCSTQADLDANLPELLRCPAAVRWLSLEPMLEKLRLGFTRAPTDDDYRGWHADGPIDSVITTRAQAIGGVVVGCESGPGRRPCKIEWIESVVDQCDDAGVPVYVKQLDLGGRVSTDMSKWPKSLRRQELLDART